MKKKLHQKNELEAYLKKKCISKTFEGMNLSDLNDFPKIDVQQIKSKITFGWYQIKQGFGYLAEHFDRNGNIEIRLDKKSFEKDTNVKVIGGIFFSRHSNSEMYEVIIKYLPNDDNPKSILAWICSCLSGHRTCGTCSHVAALIYFLSYGKYQTEPLKKPGSSLSHLFYNSITSETESENEDDYDNNDILIENDDINTYESESLVNKIITLKEESSNIKRDLSVNDCFLENKKLKNSQASQSIELFETPTPSQKIKSSQTKKVYLSNVGNNITFREFTAHIPSWGGIITPIQTDFDTNDEFAMCLEFRNLEFNQTCTIDYFLLAFWCTSKISNKEIETIETSAVLNKTSRYLHKIIKLIDIFEWDRARTLWILAILEIKPDNWIFSLFGHQSEFLVNNFLPFQELIYICSSCNLSLKPKNEFYFKKDVNGKLCLDEELNRQCKSCSNPIFGKFKTNPFCLFIQLHDKINFMELPSTITIDNQVFNLLCFTFSSNNKNVSHFKSMFYLQKSFYEVDDLNSSKLLKNLDQDPLISYCYYYLI